MPVLPEELLLDELDEDCVPEDVELCVLVVGVVGVVGVLGVLADEVSSCCAIVDSPVGGTRSGLVFGSAATFEPPPQLASTVAIATMLTRREAWRLIRAGLSRRAPPWRRPQVGQWLRSRCAIDPQFGQRRRVATDHGRLDSEVPGEHLADHLQRLAVT